MVLLQPMEAAIRIQKTLYHSLTVALQKNYADARVGNILLDLAPEVFGVRAMLCFDVVVSCC